MSSLDMTSRVGLSTRGVHVGTLYFVALLREELGKRIAAARKAAGLSQQELAHKIGLKHAQDISRYERGKVEVPSFRIDLIAEATGRQRSYFTRDPTEPEPVAPDHLRQAIREETAGILDLLQRIDARLQRVERRAG